MNNESFLANLQSIVGPSGVVTDDETLDRYTREWRGKYLSGAIAAVRPTTTEQVSAVIKACAESGISITPQGGNTGLVGGSVPIEPTREIVLSLDRMNAIEDVDTQGNTMIVQAGCILADAQQAAAKVDRVFPLSLGAEGSCRIGGNLSTNAGGINVIRYGNMRDLVLGLEVVLADGRIWNGMNRLRKTALNVLAHHLTEREIADLSKVWSQLDAGGTGVLELDEFADLASRSQGAFSLPGIAGREAALHWIHHDQPAPLVDTATQSKGEGLRSAALAFPWPSRSSMRAPTSNGSSFISTSSTQSTRTPAMQSMVSIAHGHES